MLYLVFFLACYVVWFASGSVLPAAVLFLAGLLFILMRAHKARKAEAAHSVSRSPAVEAEEEAPAEVIPSSESASSKRLAAVIRWAKRIAYAAGVFLIIYYVGNAVEEAQWQKERSQINVDTYISMCSKGDYEKVARNPSVEKDKKIYVAGKVVQVVEDGGHVVLRVQERYDRIWYVTYRYARGESHIIEGDNITVYGKCIGTVTYKSIYNQQLTIPGVEGYFVRFQNH